MLSKLKSLAYGITFRFLSKRLHVVTQERRIFEDIVNQRQCPNCPEEGEPSGDVVAEEVEKMDATEEVAVTILLSFGDTCSR